MESLLSGGEADPYVKVREEEGEEEAVGTGTGAGSRRVLDTVRSSTGSIRANRSSTRPTFCTLR